MVDPFAGNPFGDRDIERPIERAREREEREERERELNREREERERELNREREEREDLNRERIVSEERLGDVSSASANSDSNREISAAEIGGGAAEGSDREMRDVERDGGVEIAGVRSSHTAGERDGVSITISTIATLSKYLQYEGDSLQEEDPFVDLSLDMDCAPIIAYLLSRKGGAKDGVQGGAKCESKTKGEGEGEKEIMDDGKIESQGEIEATSERNREKNLQRKRNRERKGDRKGECVDGDVDSSTVLIDRWLAGVLHHVLALSDAFESAQRPLSP